MEGQNFTLEELHIVADETGLSEELALDALKHCQGSVADAIDYLEGLEDEKEAAW